MQKETNGQTSSNSSLRSETENCIPSKPCQIHHHWVNATKYISSKCLRSVSLLCCWLTRHACLGCSGDTSETSRQENQQYRRGLLIPKSWQHRPGFRVKEGLSWEVSRAQHRGIITNSYFPSLERQVQYICHFACSNISHATVQKRSRPDLPDVGIVSLKFPRFDVTYE